MSKGENLLNTFRNLKGNARPCIWTEWMWAVPNTLYSAYVTLYMRAIGLSLVQIGYVSSICLAMQVVAALLSGAICDKLGRRFTTALFDCISWGIPVILWCAAQSYEWFVIAALFNGVWRVTGVSFGLLMAEDQNQDELVGIFSINQFMSLLSALFAPISMICINKWGLIPTMRVIYGVSIVLYFSKFIILYFMTKESDIGIRRMQETRDKSIFSLIWDCRNVFWQLLKSSEMLLTIGILVAYNAAQTLNTNFWSVIVTERMGIAEDKVSLFTTVKSFAQIAVIILIVPHISSAKFKKPMLYAWGAFALSQFILIFTPAGFTGSAFLLVISVLLEALALSCMYPVMESLLYINSDPEQRSRILGMMYAVMVLIMTFFPMIAGKLSELIDIRAPLFINIVLFALGSLMTLRLWKIRKNA